MEIWGRCLRCDSGRSSGLSLSLCLPVPLSLLPHRSPLSSPLLHPPPTVAGRPGRPGPQFQCCLPEVREPLACLSTYSACPAGCQAWILFPGFFCCPWIAQYFWGSWRNGLSWLPAVPTASLELISLCPSRAHFPQQLLLAGSPRRVSLSCLELAPRPVLSSLILDL